MESFWWIAGAIGCAICTIVGSLGNALTITIFIKFHKFRNAIGFLIMSLAIADFVCSIFVTSANTAFFVNDGKWQFSLIFCMMNRVMTFGTFTVAAILITLISFNRYIQICCTADTYSKIFSNRNTGCMIMLSWFYSFILHILVCLEIGGKIEHDDQQGTCNSTFTSMWIVYIGTFIITMIVIVFSYINICITVFRSRKAISRQRHESVLEDSVNSKLLKMLITTTLIYALSFAAALVIGTISIFQTSSQNHENYAVQTFFYKVPICVGVVSNPIIYGVTNMSYRKAYKNILQGAFKCFKNQDITSSVPCTTET